MKRSRTNRFWRAAAQSLLGFTALAVLTWVCFRLGLNLSTTAFAYLILMVLLSLTGSFLVVAALCIVAVGCLSYFFADFRVDYSQDAVIVSAFLVTSLVVTGLARRARGLALATLGSQKALGEQASLLDLTHDTVFVRDMNDVITYWNRGAEELYGWTRKGAVGKVTHQLTQTIFPAPLEEINAELLRTGRWEGELIHTKRDGTRVVVASRWALQRDKTGKPVAILETNNDVTERKRAEEALRESEEQWKAVFEHNPTMYFMVDAAGAILSVNPFGAEQLGYAVNELTGQPVLNVFPETDREDVRRNVAICFEQLGRTMSWEAHKVRKDGTVLWVRETAKAMVIKKRPVALMVCEDITERKRAEEAQRAQEREREEMQRQLQQAAKMEAIGRLAGGISHDFNNILGAILGYSELAQNDLAEGGVARRHLDQVVLAGTRAKGLVERILTFSRSGLGERVPVHAQSVVEETLDLLAASLPPQVRLETKLDAGDVAVVGEATQLHQVVMNLCTNAVQAMGQEGVLRVVLDRVALPERRLLSHGTLSPRAYVRLAVSDTGSGIPPEVLERMFEPFFTTKGVREGTGLGLAQVHGIVADFGGAIDVATQADVSTTFTIWLPAAGDTARPTPEVAWELPRGNGETLMIVDDERPLVALAEETLAELGYDPAGFDSSVAALQAFRAEPQRFDLVLTDETMPDLTGVELAGEIRRLRHELPIVLMSGSSDAQLVARAHAAGVGEVLRKPLVRRDIAEALARALRPAR